VENEKLKVESAERPPVDPNLPNPDHEPESFQDFHNEMRKYRRRVFVRKETGTVTRTAPKLKGKALKRAVKKMKVAALKDGGHGKGDNRKVIWRDPAAENPTIKGEVQP
jgi:hypothetical protein